MDHLNSTFFDGALAFAILAFIAVTATVSIGSYRRRGSAVDVGGSLVLGPGVRGWFLENLQPFEDLCVQWHISPAALSCAQLAGSIVVAACYARGMLFTGGWLLLFTGTLDVIDGRVARRTNGSSARGAFLDSIIDRYADAFACLGLAAFFRDSWVLWAVLLALLGGLIVSYTRARAEGLGAVCRVGLLQRPERYVILGFGTIFGALCEPLTGPWVAGQHYSMVILVVVALALLVNLTAVQRVVHVWRTLGDGQHG